MHLSRTVRLAIAIAASAVVVVVGTWAWRGDAVRAPSARTTAAGRNAAEVSAPAPVGLLPPGERVAFWEARVARGGSYLDLILLADAYLDRVRAGGDLRDLQRAELALRKALRTSPEPDKVRVRQASVAFAQHEFNDALAIASDILERQPDNLAAQSVAADSQLELGDVAGAAATYERLAADAASPAASVRLARIAFLTGDIASAVEYAREAAAEAAIAGFPDEVAFYSTHLAGYLELRGDLDGARRAARTAVRALPDYAPGLAALARVSEAVGHRAAAIRLMERAAALLPQPEHLGYLGDLYAVNGRHDLAEIQYRTVEAVATLNRGTSVYDRAYVLFLADHGRRTGLAVRMARAELQVRRDIYAYDALAWALLADGQADRAWAVAQSALGLGTPDPRIAYHAGMAAAAAGHPVEALELLRRAEAAGSVLSPLKREHLESALTDLGGGDS